MVRSLRSKKDKKWTLPSRIDLSFDDRYTIEVAGDNAAVVHMRNFGSN
jgi:hypothetical protein